VSTLELTVRECVSVLPFVAYVGQDSTASWWVSLEAAGSPRSVGTRLERPVGQLLPCPSGVDPALLPRILESWPAWDLVRQLDLELGAGVLIIGDEVHSEHASFFCACHGCLWCVCWGDVRAHGNAVVVRKDSSLDEVRERLPSAPDAILVLLDGIRGLGAALELCRDRGTVAFAASEDSVADVNLYPDVHRRGLRVVFTPRDAVADTLRRRWVADSTRLARVLAHAGPARC
jgi:hypothetical protein